MKKITRHLWSLMLAGSLFSGCTKENAEEIFIEAGFNEKAFVGQDIEDHHLFGKWVIASMTGDAKVDLNADGVAHADLLLETTCFNEMYFLFKEEGNMETFQSRINVSGGKVSCAASDLFTAGYTMNGSTLMATFIANDQEITLTKTIGLSEDAQGDYLHVAFDSYELGQLINDPGNTAFSEVTRIEITYLKI